MVQNDPTIPIQKGLQCDGKKISFFCKLNMIFCADICVNNNVEFYFILVLRRKFVPTNYEFPVFDDDLNVFLLNPNSIASFKILNSIILSIIRSIVKHICGTSNDCLYMTSIPKNTMLIILNKIDANYPILPKKYNELNCDAKNGICILCI